MNDKRSLNTINRVSKHITQRLSIDIDDLRITELILKVWDILDQKPSLEKTVIENVKNHYISWLSIEAINTLTEQHLTQKI